MVLIIFVQRHQMSFLYSDSEYKNVCQKNEQGQARANTIESQVKMNLKNLEILQQERLLYESINSINTISIYPIFIITVQTLIKNDSLNGFRFITPSLPAAGSVGMMTCSTNNFFKTSFHHNNLQTEKDLVLEYSFIQFIFLEKATSPICDGILMY